jgi:hypothetical protein
LSMIFPLCLLCSEVIICRMCSLLIFFTLMYFFKDVLVFS